MHCLCRKDKYDKILAKTERKVSKELDLIKFIKRQRIQSYAMLASLETQQQYFIEKLSSMQIWESSDFNDSSNDDPEVEEERVQDFNAVSKVL